MLASGVVPGGPNGVTAGAGRGQEQEDPRRRAPGTVTDDVVCLRMPGWFTAVGQGYRHFEKVSDQEVVERWLRRQPGCETLPIGFFSASTGAAAARWAAADPHTHVGAVVSRGGDPDLAAAQLTQVQAPTLLIVGGNDEAVRTSPRTGS